VSSERLSNEGITGLRLFGLFWLLRLSWFSRVFRLFVVQSVDNLSIDVTNWRILANIVHFTILSSRTTANVGGLLPYHLSIVFHIFNVTSGAASRVAHAFNKVFLLFSPGIHKTGDSVSS
jgi:hypothetical protein